MTKKKKKRIGGIDILYRKDGNLRVDEKDVLNNAMSEDILAMSGMYC